MVGVKERGENYYSGIMLIGEKFQSWESLVTDLQN